MEKDDEMMSEDEDEFVDLDSIRDKVLHTPKCDRMQVSGWDEDDDTGVDADLNAEEPDAKAFLSAAEDGKLHKIIKLFMKDKNLLKCVDKDGYTPLHRACYGNHVHVVQYLLENGAQIDAETEDKWQPLHSAACWNNVECAAVLIENGANINAKSKGEQTPLHLVSSNSNNSSMLQLFLLNPDIEADAINSSGDTPLMIAKRHGIYHSIFEVVEPCMYDIHGKITE